MNAAEPAWEIIDWPDLDWALRIQAGEFLLHFEAYKVLSREWSQNGKSSTAPLYDRAATTFSPDPTDDITEAEWVFRGTVKWVGCSHWEWNTAGCMWHGCSMQDVVNHAEAMKRVYVLAGQRIPDFAGVDLEPTK